MNSFSFNQESNTVLVSLGESLFTILDKESFDLIFARMRPNTSLRRTKSRDRYYCEFSLGRNNVAVHRFLMQPSDGDVVDHINGNSLDNRLCNLRVVSYSINMISRTKEAGLKYTTNLTHISWKKRAKSFYVVIAKDGVQHSKGGFKTIDEAIIYHKSKLPELYPNDYMNIFILNGYVENKT